MRFIVKLILFWTSCSGITSGLTVTYEELREMNATCYPNDTCTVPRTDDVPRESKSCSCDESCARYNTCCMDSLYNGVKSPGLQPTCRRMREYYTDPSYFMLDRCDNTDSVWETLCNDEWDGEDDVLKLVPVTSLTTSMTYRNYYCFRCHETTDDFVYWNVRLRSVSRIDVQGGMEDVELSYNDDDESWVATSEAKNISISVQLIFEVPLEISTLPIKCDSDMISNCSNEWMDESTSEKCGAYSAVIYITKEKRRYGSKRKAVFTYRNAHCALCNFQSLDRMTCERPDVATSGAGHGGHGNKHKVGFSFTHLLDVNRSDGDKVGKIRKCKENSLFDPFAKKCRILICAIPGYVVQEGKCVRR